MDTLHLPQKTQENLLGDAIGRDRTTARRACLAQILYHERSLTRKQLIARVEGQLGKRCFGEASWKDTFYRDMRVVKKALNAAGYQLAYSRKPHSSGYYLRDQPPLSLDLARILDGSVAEVDQAQINTYRQMSTADRFHQGVSISDTARLVVTYRIQHRNPELALREAHHLALQGRQEHE
jgi:hypothetical protein